MVFITKKQIFTSKIVFRAVPLYSNSLILKIISIFQNPAKMPRFLCWLLKKER